MTTASYLLLPWFATSGATPITEGRGDVVRLMKIYVPADITVAQISIIAASSVTGEHWGIGLYNLAGTTRVLDSGPIVMSTTGSNELLTASITPVLVPENTYWLAFTSDSSTSSLVSAKLRGNPINIMCLGTSVAGQAANSSSAGQLPSTTGVISVPVNPTEDQLAPFVKLQA